MKRLTVKEVMERLENSRGKKVNFLGRTTDAPKVIDALSTWRPSMELYYEDKRKYILIKMG